MSLPECFHTSPLILTEGAVGQRLEHEYALQPDADIVYAAMLYDPAGRKALAAIYRSYLRVAEEAGLPILLMTNTRRANRERVLRSKYRAQPIMRDYTRLLLDLADGASCPVYVGGMMGCRGDAYSGTEGLSTQQAVDFHTWQLQAFDLAQLDFLFAGIMPTLPEAIGMARVMETSRLPYIISFMLRRDGRLLDGVPLGDAILAIDSHTCTPPLCYMTNCIHPAILQEALAQPCNRGAHVAARFRGIQANAACLDPDRLDGSATLHTCGAEALTDAFVSLHSAFPLQIYGGCCGTDASHLRGIAERLG